MKVEMVFVIEPAPEGGYLARALRHSIYAEADTWKDLDTAIQDAVTCHFDEDHWPLTSILLHYVGMNPLSAL